MRPDVASFALSALLAGAFIGAVVLLVTQDGDGGLPPSESAKVKAWTTSASCPGAVVTHSSPLWETPATTHVQSAHATTAHASTTGTATAYVQTCPTPCPVGSSVGTTVQTGTTSAKPITPDTTAAWTLPCQDPCPVGSSALTTTTRPAPGTTTSCDPCPPWTTSVTWTDTRSWTTTRTASATAGSSGTVQPYTYTTATTSPVTTPPPYPPCYTPTPAPTSFTQAPDPERPVLPVVDVLPYGVAGAPAVPVGDTTYLVGPLQGSQDHGWGASGDIRAYESGLVVATLPWQASAVSAAALDGDLYVFGGAWANDAVTLVSNGTTFDLPTWPVGLHSAAVTLDDQIIVFPRGSSPLAFDPVNATFHALPGTHPGDTTTFQEAVVWNEKVILQTESWMGPLVSYHPDTGFAPIKTQLPPDLRGGALAVVGDTLYIYGGVTDYWTERTDIWSVDLPTGNTTVLDVQLPSARPFAAAAVVDGAVLVFGGGFGESSYEVLRHEV